MTDTIASSQAAASAASGPVSSTAATLVPVGLLAGVPDGVLAGVPDGVRSLDAGSVLAEVAAQRAAADRAEARLLALAVHFVDLHPVTATSPAASGAPGERLLYADTHPHAADDAAARTRAADAGTHGDVDTHPDADVGLGGVGTPGVAQYAVEELAAVLSVPYGAGLRIVGDAVELAYRLPRLWARVQAGRVQAWRATLVARHTTGLPVAAVEFVDRQVAILADRRRMPTLAGVRDLVHQAWLRVDPDHDRAVEETATGRRGVWFDHQTSTASAATTTMAAVLDAWDALTLDSTITGLAATMADLGDTDPLDVRRADALALLAHPQRALDLSTSTHPTRPPHDLEDTNDPGAAGDDRGDRGAAPVSDAGGVSEASAVEPALSSTGRNGDVTAAAVGATGTSTAPPTRSPRTRGRSPGSSVSFYVHATLADLAHATLATLASGDGIDRGPDGGADTAARRERRGDCAVVERLGPMSLTLLQDWLTRTDKITLRPVLDPTPLPTDPDMTATRPVDQHDPPSAMRELVILRDGTCVFPGCRTPARACDLDHTDPYLHPDTGGPPGQTRPDNLACLCRRHHRLKTFTAWRYQRAPHSEGDADTDANSGTGGCTSKGLGDSYVWTSPRGQTFTTHPQPRHGPG